MPGFNLWTPRTNAFLGNQLQHTQHSKNSIGPWHDRASSGARFAGQLGHVAGSALGFAGAYGYRRGSWYRPSATIPVRRRRYVPSDKKKKRKRKTCCRYVKGRKVCRPEYCSKNKKYWY